MRITREKLLNLQALIESLGSEKTTVRFHYLLLKIKRSILPEIESLQEATEKPPEGYTEFDEKRMKLCNEHCEKTEDGKPKLQNQNFVIAEDKKEAFDEAMKALKEEYKEALEAVEKRQKEFLDLLKEEVKIDCPRIPLSIMPDVIKGSDLELLFDLVDEDK
jgi:hypothetical protein